MSRQDGRAAPMRYILSLLAAAAGIVILVYPDEISGAIGGAVSDCLEIIVPSLFAFTVLAVFLQSSGLYRTALKPLALPLSKLLRLDEELCAVIILSNIGGYPVGVKLLSALVKGGRLSRGDAGKMLCCCFGSGPSFVIGIVGTRVFGSAAAGAVIFCACFASSLIMAAAIRAKGDIILIGKAPSCDRADADCFIGSVMTAARVMLTVCAMITAFSVVARLLDIIGVNAAAERIFSLLGAGENAPAILPSLLEVTRLKALSAEGGRVVPLCAGALSFGGVCVLLQVSALSDGVPMKAFLLSRPIAAALSALLSLPAVWLAQHTEAAIAPNIGAGAAEVSAVSVNAAASACVLVMCGILLSGGTGRAK